MAKDRGFGVVTNDGDTNGINFDVGGSVSGAPIIDPAAVGSDTGNGGSGATTGEQPAKRRGRKPGSTNKSTAPKIDISGVEALLYNIHGMLGMITKTPELMLTTDEAKALAEATVNVAKYYDTRASAKTLAWVNMGMVAGAIYGSRIVSLAAKRKNAQKSAAPQQNQSPFQVVG